MNTLITHANVLVGTAVFFVKKIAKTNITPNQITAGRLLLFIPLMAFSFSRGEYWGNILGLFFYFVFYMFDIIDGHLARYKSMTSKCGELAEDLGDRFTIMIVFSSIAYGFFNKTGRFDALFIVFVFLIIEDIQMVVFVKLKENGAIIKGPEVDEARRKLGGKKMGLIDKFFFDLLFLHKSLLVFLFAKTYPFILGILLNRIVASFTYIIITGLIYLVFTIYVLFDFIRIKPKLLIVRALKTINKHEFIREQ